MAHSRHPRMNYPTDEQKAIYLSEFHQSVAHFLYCFALSLAFISFAVLSWYDHAFGISIILTALLAWYAAYKYDQEQSYGTRSRRI